MDERDRNGLPLPLQNECSALQVQTITATFEDGVLKPTQPLNLPAHAVVRATIELLPAPPLTVGQLNAFLRNLPALGDDAEAFAQEVRPIRAELPAEANPWD
jgi:predicted DNA-binding antitoxin AbrB/MazE fold protein